ncbi:MAG: aminoacyl-tRNA hydrolase [Clostridiaceae bacterium]|nr:aminoacyl-tRNA hydrolase [Clostridiaceae bacterium]
MMSRDSDRWLIVGLGNPGARYEDTWHNMGRIAVSVFAERHGLLLSKRRFQGITAEGRIAGKRVLLLQPETFMNLSGNSVASAMAYYDIAPTRLIVLYDDFDLPLGYLRIRNQGGAGSHNGMKSILNHVRDQHFFRVRIGIGPVRGNDNVVFVLSRFPKEEKEIVSETLSDAVDAVELLLTDNAQRAMERFNRKSPPQLQHKEPESD